MLEMLNLELIIEEKLAVSGEKQISFFPPLGVLWEAFQVMKFAPVLSYLFPVSATLVRGREPVQDLIAKWNAYWAAFRFKNPKISIQNQWTPK